MKVILASQSPRRIELLQTIIDNFDVMPQNVDETIHYRKPHLAVTNLAKRKLEPLTYNSPSNTLIISADTVVWYDNKYYNKPSDRDDAIMMLKELRGKEHFVYTGVCLFYNGIYRMFYDRSSVYMRDLTDEEILKYVDSGSPMDKAGAYGIQDGDIVERYEGSYSNIVGLPLEKLKIEIGIITEDSNGKD